MKKCFLCYSEISDFSLGRTSGPIIYNVFCEKCGAYKISDILKKIWNNEDKKAILWYLKEGADQIKDEYGIALINEDNIEYIRQEYRKK
ncbi:MAG: hypothetical protein WC458_02915 [Patescibacteria group bacterium]